MKLNSKVSKIIWKSPIFSLKVTLHNYIFSSLKGTVSERLCIMYARLRSCWNYMSDGISRISSPVFDSTLVSFELWVMGQPRSWQLLSRTSIQWRGPLQFYSLMQVFGRSCRNLNCAHYWQSALNCTHTCTHSLRRCMNLRQKPFKQDMAKEGAWPKGRRQDSAVAENACPRMYIHICVYKCLAAHK